MPVSFYIDERLLSDVNMIDHFYALNLQIKFDICCFKVVAFITKRNWIQFCVYNFLYYWFCCLLGWRHFWASFVSSIRQWPLFQTWERILLLQGNALMLAILLCVYAASGILTLEKQPFKSFQMYSILQVLKVALKHFTLFKWGIPIPSHAVKW